MQRDYFSTAVAFLDVFHLEKRLGEAGRSQLGGLLDRALRGDVDGLVQQLTELWAAAAEDDERRTVLAALIVYVEENRTGIANYQRFGPQLTVPLVSPGSACPVSPGRPADTFSPFGTGYAAGAGPVYALLGPSAAVGFGEPVGGWYQGKVLWMLAPDARGNVIIRGRQIDSQGALGGRRQPPWGWNWG